jgi:hypothetical protein
MSAQQACEVKQNAATATAGPAPLPQERKIVFAANATAEAKCRGVARLLAARKEDVAAAYDCAQWYYFGAVLEKCREAAVQWARYAAERGCLQAMEMCAGRFASEADSGLWLTRAVAAGSQRARCLLVTARGRCRCLSRVR